MTSNSSSGGSSSLTDIDLLLDDSLYELKHFVDVYSQPSKGNKSKSLESRLPGGAGLDTLRGAVRYAKDRSHALDLEILQLEDRLAEIQSS